jgi:diphthamide synthase (EF-2-diphthine--ammonia ligase)
VLLSWSSGKDSAWTLYQLQRDPSVEVVGLLTTYNQAFARSAIHGVRLSLVRAQADAADLPLLAIPLPWPCSNEQYERAMRIGLEEAQQQFSPDAIAFGDLFLEDIRAYRESRMAQTGLNVLFTGTSDLSGSRQDAPVSGGRRIQPGFSDETAGSGRPLRGEW